MSSNTYFHDLKIAVIGTGFVGSSFAYCLMSYGTASEIVLIDVNKKRTEGEAMDLNHGVSLVRPVRVWAGDYQDYEDADIIVITARLAQKSGRQELAEPDETVKASSSEEIEIGAVKKEEKRKKARLRRRGTYRKAHTD